MAGAPDFISTKSLIAAGFDTGECVVFVPTSGDVVTCSTDAFNEWLDFGTGELATLFGRLGIPPSDRLQPF